MPTVSKFILAFVAIGFHHCAAQAQQYPAKPIRLIVLIAPGGAPDLGARVLAPVLGERLGQAVAVETPAGSKGNIAGDYVAKSPPDGYTILYRADSLVAINPHVYARMPFDTLKDIVPVASTTGTSTGPVRGS